MVGSHQFPFGEKEKTTQGNRIVNRSMSGAGRLIERNGQRIWHVVDAKGQVIGLEFILFVGTWSFGNTNIRRSDG